MMYRHNFYRWQLYINLNKNYSLSKLIFSKKNPVKGHLKRILFLICLQQNNICCDVDD